MTKIVFGIFAHPDDEAFGPASTLLDEAKQGAEVHLVSLTAGENGSNPDDLPDLPDVRLAEWHEAGKLIGAKEMHHLGHIDGELDNMTLIQVADHIEKLITKTIDSHSSDCEVEIISMDTNGISGHIDHIVASYAAHLVFYRLKEKGAPVTQLRLYCIPRQQTGAKPNTKFVFMEPGRLTKEINQTLDHREYLPEVIAIMRCYHTQREDCDHHIEHLGDKVAIDNFIVKQ